MGSIATEDDDLSEFAKSILNRIELHKTIENEEISDKVCLLTGYKKLPYIYDCEQERSKLIRLVCRHPTEWRDTPKKAELLKLNDAQKKQIKALSWWDDASGVKGLPESQNVWHFHPAGFVGNFAGGGLITYEILKTACPSLSDTYINEALPYFNEYAEAYKVNKKYRLAHFLSQVGHESCFKVTEENLNFILKRAKEIWSSSLHPKFWTNPDYFNVAGSSYLDKEKYANYVYRDRMDNGNEASGGGYKYRGRGIIQLTGKYNYRQFTNAHNLKLPNDKQNFVDNPDLIVSNIEYGIESGFYFWAELAKLNKLADKGASSIRSITKKVNGGYNGISDRTKKYKKLLILIGDIQ